MSLSGTEMSPEGPASFIAWPLTTEDISTDECILERGRGQGLTAYRERLCATIPREDLEEKRLNAATPEEIGANRSGRYGPQRSVDPQRP